MATETVTSAEIGTSPESLLRGLFKRAEDRLTDDELLTVAMLGEQAQNIVGYIEILCDGIGCLVAEDSDRETGAGNFQCGDDVAPPTHASAAGWRWRLRCRHATRRRSERSIL